MMAEEPLQFFESSYQTTGYDRPDLQPMPSHGMSTMTFMNSPTSGTNIHDAPPLLEELGIDFGHIKRQTLSILTIGFSQTMGRHARPSPDQELVHADLTGPLLYCLLFGFVLLLSGNNHFGYVYGFGGIGSVGIFGLLNLMNPQGIALYQCISVLGYSLVPMIFLSFLRLLFSLNGLYGALIAGASILWCSYSASYLFVKGLHMNDHLILVMYPLALFYTAFGLLAIF